MNYFTFSMDDGYASWIDAAGILEEYGYRGTFNTCLRNVVHKRVPTRPRMFPEKDVITWGEVQELQRRGHEIASHGIRHVDLPLCNTREKEFEINGSHRIFKSRGIDVNSYTCAFNVYDAECIEISKRFYSSFRVHVGVNQFPPRKRTYQADNPSAVDDVCNSDEDGLWFVGVWHDVPLEGFRRRCEQIKKAGISVVTVRQAYGF